MHCRWNSCLQWVSYKEHKLYAFRNHMITWTKNTNTDNSFIRQCNTEAIDANSIYSGRITLGECLKANAASIITSILNSPFHKSCCRCGMTSPLLDLFHSWNLEQTKPGTEFKCYETFFFFLEKQQKGKTMHFC